MPVSCDARSVLRRLCLIFPVLGCAAIGLAAGPALAFDPLANPGFDMLPDDVAAPGCDDDVRTDMVEMAFHAVDRGDHMGNVLIEEPPDLNAITCAVAKAGESAAPASILFPNPGIAAAAAGPFVTALCEPLDFEGGHVSKFLIEYGYLCHGTAPGCIQQPGGDPTGPILTRPAGGPGATGGVGNRGFLDNLRGMFQ